MGKRRKNRSNEELRAMFAKLSSSSLNPSRSSNMKYSRTANRKYVDPRVIQFIQSGASGGRKIDGIKIPNRKSVEKKSKITQPPPIVDAIKKIPQNNVVGLIALGTSIATGNPLPLLAYKSFKVVKIMNEVSERMQKIKLSEELIDITKKNLEATSQKILEKKTEEISKKVAEQSQEVGLISALSNITHFNENATKLLFQNTIQDTIDSGIGNVTSLAVDTIL